MLGGLSRLQPQLYHLLIALEFPAILEAVSLFMSLDSQLPLLRVIPKETVRDTDGLCSEVWFSERAVVHGGLHMHAAQQ